MSAPIGIFDSGLGGLTVRAALVEALPERGYLYLADTAHAPYGPRAPAEIEALTRRGVARLWQEGCRLVIIACNTASAIALRPMQQRGLPEGRRVLGVFVPVIEVLTQRRWSDGAPPEPTGLASVAFFATEATVESGAFPREMARRSSDTEVYSEACPGLVDALEAGARARASAVAEAAVARLIRRVARPGAAVLGCTHYPLVEAAFRQGLPSGTPVLSQPRIVAERLAEYLSRHPDLAPPTAQPTRRCLTTGAPEAVSARAAAVLPDPPHFASAQTPEGQRRE